MRFALTSPIVLLALVASSPAQPPRPQPGGRSLANLAAANDWGLPSLDSDRIRAAGIRRLEGRHVTIYTDLPPAPGIEDLPQAFDAAVPLWCDYFHVDPAHVQDWKTIASVMKDRESFIAAGLYPQDRLPDFPHGYALGSQLFLYDQPSDYFRRHLLLHEGTHAFMLRWLNGAGPPWYMEGLAELLGTHHWADGQLKLGIMPASKEEVPYWGRVKIIKDAYRSGSPLSLLEIMRFDPQAQLRVEAYGWCWAAAAFLDAHPLTQAAFRQLKSRVTDRTLEFSKHFYESVKPHWPAIVEDWQVFVANCDYGYDVARAAAVRKVPSPPAANGTMVTLRADRGWQSTGCRLEAGQTYEVSASGRYDVRPSWPCEPGGITIHYAANAPLGMLLGSLTELEEPGNGIVYTPLASPQPIGRHAELTPEVTGTLYLRINESASGLADNTGTLEVKIHKK